LGQVEVANRCEDDLSKKKIAVKTHGQQNQAIIIMGIFNHYYLF
jgi:hypothetical protein